MSEKVILLVEDSENDIMLTVRALQRTIPLHRLIISRDGIEALERLMGENTESATLPDIVLLDINMPKMDGLKVLEKIRSSEKTRCLPVIMLTSSKEDTDIITSYRLGANSYIRKPVSFFQFTEAVNQIVNYWLGINESPPVLGESS
jgi:two-component system response regulator